MSGTTNASLSPRAAAAYSQISAFKKKIDEVGITAVNTLIKEIVGALNVSERKEIEDILCGVSLETPKQVREKACDFLRRNRLRIVAVALEDAQLPPSWIEDTISGAIADENIPEWVRKILQDRLNAVQTTIRRIENPQKSKKESASQNVGSVRERISLLLDQMRKGRWVYNLIHDEVVSLNGESSTVSDLLELVEQEKDPCWKKCRAPASEHLETTGHSSSAQAIYEDFEGAEEAIRSARKDNNVAGWVKAMLTHRLEQVQKNAQERYYSETRASAIVKTENLVGLIDQIMDILHRASSVSVRVQQALLREAKEVYEDAKKIQFLLRALEEVIAGKSGTDNFVMKLLEKDPELAGKVALALGGSKASVFRSNILKSAERGISSLAEVVEQRALVPPDPGVKYRPNLMQRFDDRRDCRVNRRPPPTAR